MSDPPFALMLYPGLVGWHWLVRHMPNPEDCGHVVAQSRPDGCSLPEAYACLPGKMEMIHETWRRGERLPSQPEPGFNPWRSDFLLYFAMKHNQWFFAFYRNNVLGHYADGGLIVDPEICASGGPMDTLENALRSGMSVMNMVCEAIILSAASTPGGRTRMH